MAIIPKFFKEVIESNILTMDAGGNVPTGNPPAGNPAPAGIQGDTSQAQIGQTATGSQK
jgi:hypothetical protein